MKKASDINRSKKKPAAGTRGRTAHTAPARKSSRKVKAWYVARFHKRYELAEDVRFDRKSPLLYTKDFVGSGTDNESCAFFRQLMALRSKRSWLELRGAFSELKSIAGNQSRVYRGYLLDSNFKPASTREIGRWLGVDEKAAERILTELEDVGLLERVTLPKFDVCEGGSGKAGGGKAKKSATRRKRTKTKVATAAPERTRARTSQPERAREALKKAKTKSKSKDNVNGQTATSGLTAVVAKGKKNGNRGTPNTNVQAGQDEGQAHTPPLPFGPRLSDDGGARLIPITQSPPGSASQPGPRTAPSGTTSEAVYDRCDVFFGTKVYVALGFQWDTESPEGKREICSFASVHHQAMQALCRSPPEVRDQMSMRLIAEATKIARRRGRQNKAAVWCAVAKKIVNKHSTKAM